MKFPVCGTGAVCGHEVQPRAGRKVGAQAHVRAAGAVGRVADRGESVNESNDMTEREIWEAVVHSDASLRQE